MRFDKARSDVEFEKMMKARVLSPEQTELQTQLRRDLRVSRDTRMWAASIHKLMRITVYPKSGHKTGRSSTSLQKEA
jgi:hypothetical protein